MSNEQIKEGLRVAAWLGPLSLSAWLIDDRTPPYQPLLGVLCLIGGAGVLYKNISRWIGPVVKFVAFVPVIGVGILALSLIPRDAARLPNPRELPLTETIVFVSAICIAAVLLRTFGFRSLNKLDRWFLTIAGLLLFFPVGIFFGREHSIAGAVAAPCVLLVAWLADKAQRGRHEREASFSALSHSVEPQEPWLSTLSDAAFGPVGALTAAIVGIGAVLSALGPKVDERDERILVASSRQILTLYNQSDFAGIADMMLDDLSLGENRMELGLRRRVFANRLRALNEATGPCDESIDDYGVSRERVPRFRIRLDLACRNKSVNVVLVWGKRQNNPELNLIGYQLPAEYYFEIPGLGNSTGDLDASE